MQISTELKLKLQSFSHFRYVLHSKYCLQLNVCPPCASLTSLSYVEAPGTATLVPVIVHAFTVTCRPRLSSFFVSGGGRWGWGGRYLLYLLNATNHYRTQEHDTERCREHL